MILPLLLSLALSTKTTAHVISITTNAGPERALVHVQDCKGLPTPIFQDRNLVVPRPNVFYTSEDGTAVYFSPSPYFIETIDLSNGRETIIKNCPYKK